MTGFGRATRLLDAISITVEIRAVNARQTDIRIKVPGRYRNEEHAFRSKLQEVALRGKIDATVERRSIDQAEVSEGINTLLFHQHARQLKRLVPEFEQDPLALASAILRLPNVIGVADELATEQEVAVIHQVFGEAIAEFLSFRKTEGGALAGDLIQHVIAIQTALPEVEAFEPERQNKMRERLTRLVEENSTGTAVDRNRLEQEVLFYLEKFDISEEKARLRQHCLFFVDSLHDTELEKGRRLSFIAQEMGREINTLGAKAYSADIQKVVVGMKDELEKIKEQLANAV